MDSNKNVPNKELIVEPHEQNTTKTNNLSSSWFLHGTSSFEFFLNQMLTYIIYLVGVANICVLFYFICWILFVSVNLGIGSYVVKINFAAISIYTDAYFSMFVYSYFFFSFVCHSEAGDQPFYAWINCVNTSILNQITNKTQTPYTNV